MNNATTMMEIYRPRWLEDLLTFYRGRITRQFVLHFNITDFVINLDKSPEQAKSAHGNIVEAGDQLLTLREYLHRLLFEMLSCSAIYTYSLAGGLIADDGRREGQSTLGSPSGQERRGPAWQRIGDAVRTLRLAPRQQDGQPIEGQEIDLPDNLPDNFKLLGHLLRQKHYRQARPAPNEPETPVAVVLDYAEKLIPYQLGDGQGDREQLQALEVIQRWALDPIIRQTNNVIIVLTDNIGQIPNSVYSEGSGCRAIRVPLPDDYQREAFIHYAMTRARNKLARLDEQDFRKGPDEQARRLARSTQGMRLSDIDNISRRAIVEYRERNRGNPNFRFGDEIMSASDVQKAKGEAIQAQSAQLLEIVPPKRSFDDIGGLDKLKDYLRKRTQFMLNSQQSPLVPRGLLLAGPPGTGKTLIAEALATASGFNLVKMRNIQDKWIGSSERNLEMVLNLLEDLHPVIVFIDEIDQAMGQRDTGQSGDSGVGARMFGRILEAMSDPASRGRVLWVAATNRADLLDAALLRRFDRVVPLLTPDMDESCRIFATMPRTIARQGGEETAISYGKSLLRPPNQQGQEDLTGFNAVAEITYKLGLTGAGIEIVVRRAIELAFEEAIDTPLGNGQIPKIEVRHLLAAIKDFKPNHNRATYDYQSLLAIRACNFHSVIPNLPDTGPFARIVGPDKQVDQEKLEAEIDKLRAQVK